MLYGVNVDPVGSISPDSLDDVGAEAVCFVLTPHHDLREWVTAVKSRGIKTLAVLASESDPDNATAYYCRHYGPLIDAWQIGNEPDQPGFIASWAMGPQAWCDLGRRARGAIRGAGLDAPIIGGGLTSGNVDWAPDDVLAMVRRVFDAIAIHPYTQSGQSVGPLLKRYSDRYKMPVHVTEIGLPRDGDISEAAQAAYLQEMYAAIAALPYVESCYWFSMHDYLAFGLLGANGHKTESYRAYKAIRDGMTPERPRMPQQPRAPKDRSPARYHVGEGILAEMSARGDAPIMDERYMGKNNNRHSECYGASGNRYVWLPAIGKVVVYEPN